MALRSIKATIDKSKKWSFSSPQSDRSCERDSRSAKARSLRVACIKYTQTLYSDFHAYPFQGHFIHSALCK